jgi:hypothetical protein
MVEIRRNAEALRGPYGEVDEIVAENAFVHLEQLSEQGFYLIVQDGEHYVHVHIMSASGRAKVECSVYEELPAEAGLATP